MLGGPLATGFTAVGLTILGIAWLVLTGSAADLDDEQRTSREAVEKFFMTVRVNLVWLCIATNQF